MIGDKVFISIRPESIQLGTGENTLTGKITFVEFTGISVNYIVDFTAFSLKVMLINSYDQIKRSVKILQSIWHKIHYTF